MSSCISASICLLLLRDLFSLRTITSPVDLCVTFRREKGKGERKEKEKEERVKGREVEEEKW